jgi:hypothetical protein
MGEEAGDGQPGQPAVNQRLTSGPASGAGCSRSTGGPAGSADLIALREARLRFLVRMERQKG